MALPGVTEALAAAAVRDINAEVEQWKKLGCDVWSTLCNNYGHKWPRWCDVPMMGHELRESQAMDQVGQRSLQLSGGVKSHSL